jgi:hypothetical protein
LVVRGADFGGNVWYYGVINESWGSQGLVRGLLCGSQNFYCHIAGIYFFLSEMICTEGRPGPLDAELACVLGGVFFQPPFGVDRVNMHVFVAKHGRTIGGVFAGVVPVGLP